jgi:hypothetical protein
MCLFLDHAELDFVSGAEVVDVVLQGESATIELFSVRTWFQ